MGVRGLALGVGLLLGAGALGIREHVRPHSYVLSLEAERSPTASYYSVFGTEPVISNHDPRDGKTIVYRSEFEWVDGCTWQSVETLVPEEGGYSYAYDEKLVACPDGLEPDGIRTPMAGHVHASELDERLPATALYGFMVEAAP